MVRTPRLRATEAFEKTLLSRMTKPLEGTGARENDRKATWKAVAVREYKECLDAPCSRMWYTRAAVKAVAKAKATLSNKSLEFSHQYYIVLLAHQDSLIINYNT